MEVLITARNAVRLASRSAFGEAIAPNRGKSAPLGECLINGVKKKKKKNLDAN